MSDEATEKKLKKDDFPDFSGSRGISITNEEGDQAIWGAANVNIDENTDGEKRLIVEFENKPTTWKNTDTQILQENEHSYETERRFGQKLPPKSDFHKKSISQSNKKHSEEILQRLRDMNEGIEDIKAKNDSFRDQSEILSMINEIHDEVTKNKKSENSVLLNIIENEWIAFLSLSLSLFAIALYMSSPLLALVGGLLFIGTILHYV